MVEFWKTTVVGGLVLGQAANHRRRSPLSGRRCSVSGPTEPSTWSGGRPSTCCSSSAAAPGARVHPEVEGTEIDARWQRVTLQRIPIERAVDRRRGLAGHVSHVGGAKRRVVIPVPQGGQGNAHVGRAPGVGGIIDVAALLSEREARQVSNRSAIGDLHLDGFPGGV